jgi:hypothetical protein
MSFPRKRSTRSRLTAATVGSMLLVAAVSLTASGPAFGVAQPAPTTGFNAYANGTVLHAHAVQVDPTKLADVDEAFSAISMNGGGLKTQIVSEVNELVNPAVPSKNVHARAGGAEVGVGTPVPTDEEGRPIELPVAIAQAATAAPPFVDGPNATTIIPLDGALNPIANAQALQGIAAALWNPNYLFPMLGNPIGYAYGTAADIEALNVGEVDEAGDFTAPVLDTEAPGPERNVSSSQAFSYLVNNGDGTCGIAQEIHMTIAPIQIALPPNPDAPQTGLVIEVAGDWVMKGVATGKNTGNSLTYTPDPNQDPATFVLRVLDLSALPGEQVLGQLALQDILGDTGLAEQLDGLDPLLDVAVGADPRAISSEPIPDDTSEPTISPTLVSAAADVVRLKLGAGLTEGLELADLRVGHSEMKIQVPAGGVNCEIPIAKTSSVPIAEPGQQLTFQVKVPSTTQAVIPFPCELVNVKITDELSVEEANDPSNPPELDLVSGTGPKGEVGKVSADKQSITFDNIGSWKPGAPPLIVTIKAVVPDGAGTGIMKDEATALASAANCKASNSVLGSVIDAIVGNVTGGVGGGGGVEGGFFGEQFTGLTGNIRGGGPVSLTGRNVLNGPKVGKLQVLAETGPDDTNLLAVIGIVLLAVGIRMRRSGTVRS